MKTHFVSLIVGVLVSAVMSAHALAAGFEGLGDLPGGGFESFAYGVSVDGSVVVGYGDSASGYEAFRWTQTGGMVGLGDLPGDIFYSQAYGVSADGSVVVGLSYSHSGDEAYRWTQSDGMVGLGDLAGATFLSSARGVSADGSVVVGTGFSASGNEAFRWRDLNGNGQVDPNETLDLNPDFGLGDLPGSTFNSSAYAVSADGNVVVGQGTSASGTEAFRWTQGGGMVGLGDLPGGGFWSGAWDVSADGSVVVGYGDSASGTEAFRWTQSGGMVGLGDLPGGDFWSGAEAVSADGSVVVGFSNSASGEEAFIWDAVNGMRSIKTVLTSDYGLDLSAWDLLSAEAVSADGRFVVGYGYSPNGDEGWIAYLSDTVYWCDGSGAWEDRANWPLNVPRADEHVVIAPSASATVTGPSWPTTVKSLMVGGGAGSATLRTSGGGDLTVTQSITVEANGIVEHQKGTLSAQSVVNNGYIDLFSALNVAGSFQNGNALHIYAGGHLDVGDVLTNQVSLYVLGGTLHTGSGLTNQGCLNLSGGTISGATVTNDHGATFGGWGTVNVPELRNDGQMDLTGVLTVTGAGTVLNVGTIAIPGAASLYLDQMVQLNNCGTIDLNGGSIAGSGMVVNHPGGIIRGGSSIGAPLGNEGLIHADGTSTLLIQDMSAGNCPGGELRIDDGAGIYVISAFNNFGTVVLNGADATLSGGMIWNAGTIRGQGRISNEIPNTGTIRAERGVLTLADSVLNDTAGLIRATNGSTLIVAKGLATNLGDISLDGGAFDNNHHTMVNSGAITGHGSFSSGGLTNTSHVGIGGGDMDVFGSVVNNGAISVAGGCAATFYDDVSGSGVGGAGTAVFLGAVSPGSSAGQMDFGGDVVLGASSSLQIELGGTTAGSGYDQVNVAGTATLSGTLAVSLIDAFEPAAGDEFVVLTYGSRQGDFAEVTGWENGGMAHLAIYGSNDLTLHVTYFGDATLDYCVDGLDYVAWSNNYQQHNKQWLDGDFTGDGYVDGLDYIVWSNNYKQGCPGVPGAVPEPASVILLALGGVALIRPRR